MTQCDFSFAKQTLNAEIAASVHEVNNCWLSEEERRVDALALRADERRDKLRKATGRSKYPVIRRSLNGETRLSKPQSVLTESIG